MKSFQQFLSESITINGDFNGTLNVGGSQPEQATESFFGGLEGKMYRLEIEGQMMQKKMESKFKVNIQEQLFVKFIQVSSLHLELKVQKDINQKG